MDANQRGPISNGDANHTPGSAEPSPFIGDAIERLRETAARLPNRRTPHEDLKILSQTLRELRRAFAIFAPYRTQRKITIFGSARTSREAATYKAGHELGRHMAEAGWFVVTGAATGIMEAGHRGAGRDRSMGINIMLPFEQESNEIIRGDSKLVTMKYFFTRKLLFVKECDAVVCLPGGFGTMDEAFEVLTLLQTGKREIIPLVFLDAPGGTYWTDWFEFVRKQLLGERMISPDDLALFKVTDSVDTTIAEVLQFYRNYHSMEYVHGRLVLRLQHALSNARLASINRDFADILNDGDFRQEDSIPGETTKPEWASLKRLIFHFNRRSLGRLRMLIDAINE